LRVAGFESKSPRIKAHPEYSGQNPKPKTRNSKPKNMLGEGMPWHIILIFFAIGVISGRNAGLKEKKEESVKK
jgi:hypothetical protein